LQSREGEAVRAEFLFEIFQAHEFRESRASAIHAALDRSDGAPADFGSLLVREPGGADQKKSFSLVMREARESFLQIVEIKMRALRRLNRQRRRIFSICILDLTPPLPVFRMEEVAEDREKPSLHVRARLKAMDIGDCADEGLLDKIVGAIDVARQ
jgi:hypothetical protein